VFKRNLLATTAIVLGSSFTVALAQSATRLEPATENAVVPVKYVDGVPVAVILLSARGGRSFEQNAPILDRAATYSNLSVNRNAIFLSWYGYEVTNYNSSSCSSSHCMHQSGYEELAIQITGSGAPITKLQVPNAGGKFTVAIYTNGQNNKPNSPISGASATASGVNSSYCCNQLVTVTIPKTKLDAGTKYWIVENGAPPGKNEANTATWLAEDTDFTGDGRYLVNIHRFYKNSGVTRTNYTSGWEGSSHNLTQPAAEAR